MEGHTTRMWDVLTEADESVVRNRKIVEFGCGPGRFLDVISRRGGQPIGIDMSQAVEVARSNFAHNSKVLIVQGDICTPPFREGVFDAGFTTGVLHHTPDPLRGLQALVRTVRPGGWIACCINPKGGFYDHKSIRRFRQLHNYLKPIVGYRFALAYSYLSAAILTPLFTMGKRVRALSPLLSYLETQWLVILPLPDIRWRILDIFDAITPAISTTHTQDELREWMEKAGCTHIRRAGWCDTSMIGMKS